MNKLIISSFLAIGLLLGCKKKDKEPEPLEYFSFTANGVDYYYSQGSTPGGFTGSSDALGAGSAGYGLGFQIYAFSLEDPTAPGTFRFIFSSESQLPQEDTIILDGVNNRVNLIGFLKQGNNYQHYTSLPGKIIFTERSEERLKGTFEFKAELYRYKTLTEPLWTDTFIHITNGEFSIIPSS